MATVVAAVDLARVRQPLPVGQEQDEELDILVAANRTPVKAHAGCGLLTAHHLQVSQDLGVKLDVQSEPWVVPAGSKSTRMFRIWFFNTGVNCVGSSRQWQRAPLV